MRKGHDVAESDTELVISEPDPRASGLARSFARSWCNDNEYEGPTDDLLLVVSELVENARVHAGGSIRLRLRRLAQGLRVEVQDGSSAEPEPRPPVQGEPGGRGLRIVAALSSAWGREDDGDGKVVWAVVPD